MEDSNWDLSVVINRPNNVTTPNIGLVSFENDDWNTFDVILSTDVPDFNDLFEIFFIEFSATH